MAILTRLIVALLMSIVSMPMYIEIDVYYFDLVGTYKDVLISPPAIVTAGKLPIRNSLFSKSVGLNV